MATMVMPPSLTETSDITPVATVFSAACEQGAIDWQPFGAHGDLQGGVGASCEPDELAWLPACVAAVCMPGIPASMLDEKRQANPLVTKTRLTRNRLDTSATNRDGRCGRYIVLTIC